MKSEPVQIKQDEELLSRLRGKDPLAMSVLYDCYSKALFGVIMRILRNQQMAEDVLQEAFMKIWVSVDVYDEEKGRLFTWMLNITRNLAIDKLRSKEYKNDFRTESFESGSISFYGDFSSSINIDRIGIKEITESLKGEHSKLIDMLYFQGYTQSEAAEEMGLPLGTIKSRIRAALKVLARTLKSNY